MSTRAPLNISLVAVLAALAHASIIAVVGPSATIRQNVARSNGGNVSAAEV